MFTVEPFDSRFVEEAALLVAARLKALKAGVPEIPSDNVEPGPYVAKIQELVGAVPGVAALDKGRLAGFLCAKPIDRLRGRKAAYSPEWAHGVQRPDARRVLCELYRGAAALWKAEGYGAHVMTTLAHDLDVVGTLHWQGFGNIVMDAVRDMSPIWRSDSQGEFRAAGEGDLGDMVRLDHLLTDHLAGSPTFLEFPYRNEDHWKAELADVERFYPIAVVEGRVVAYLKFGPVGFGVCHTVRDDMTVAIGGAYCEVAHRSQGIARKLLDKGLAWARERGFERCSVDWESNNIEATGFWTRHFKPVCVSLMRVVD